MNYKEQIEKKARDYLGGYKFLIYTDQAMIKAFKAGAEAMREIANTWIPVEEEMPER